MIRDIQLVQTPSRLISNHEIDIGDIVAFGGGVFKVFAVHRGSHALWLNHQDFMSATSLPYACWVSLDDEFTIGLFYRKDESRGYPIPELSLFPYQGPASGKDYALVRLYSHNLPANLAHLLIMCVVDRY